MPDFINDSSPIMEAIKKDAEEHNKIVATEEVKTPEAVIENKEVLSNTEEKKVAETQPEKKVEETDFDVTSFNRKFKTEYKTSEEINSLFESSKQTDELRTSLEDYKKKIQEKDELLNKKTDGLKLFADENMYKINQILINNPSLNRSAVLKLASTNLEEMKDIDVLKLHELVKLDNTSYDEATIEFAINKKYDLTGDTSEMDANELKQYKANEYLRNKDARLAKEELKKLMSVTMPDKIDLLAMENETKANAEKAFNTNLESWKVKSKEVIDSLKEFTLEYDKGDDGKFKFVYDDEFKAYLGKNLPEYATRMGLNASDPESFKKLATAINRDFVTSKIPQMFKTFKEELFTKWQNDDYKKKHNIPDPKLTEAPNVLSDVEKKNKEANEKISKNINQNYF